VSIRLSVTRWYCIETVERILDTRSVKLITGLFNGPVLFCTLTSVICNAAGMWASHRAHGNSAWECCRQLGRPASMRVDGRRAGGRACGWSGGWHCTAGQYGYVPLGWHLVIKMWCCYNSSCPQYVTHRASSSFSKTVLEARGTWSNQHLWPQLC